MATLGRAVINMLNRWLAKFNLSIDTLTAAQKEDRRLVEAVRRNDFETAIYPIPESFRKAQLGGILSELRNYRDRFESFRDPTLNDVEFGYENGFFTSPDAEILYTFVRRQRPNRILEVGCGNSSKIIRQAIIDGDFKCRHTCVDPQPRSDVLRLADTVLRVPIESLKPQELAHQLREGDILFIDTSHEVKPANDVAYLYGRLLPCLSNGVVVHIHDIFLPYEYPITWVRDQQLAWGEQYLVQMMLMGSTRWEVLWPGYYLQRTLNGFSSHFPNMQSGFAQSFWLSKSDEKLAPHE